MDNVKKITDLSPEELNSYISQRLEETKKNPKFQGQEYQSVLNSASPEMTAKFLQGNLKKMTSEVNFPEDSMAPPVQQEEKVNVDGPAKDEIITPGETEKDPSWLAAKFESSGGKNIIGWDKVGGLSVGPFQMAERGKDIPKENGTIKKFLDFLSGEDEEAYKRLFPLFKKEKNLTTSGPFANMFRVISKRSGFNDLQKRFIRESHYDEMIGGLKNDGIDLSKAPEIIKSAMYSTSVHHGAPRGVGIVKGALNGKKEFDEDAINRLYDERKTRFPNATPRERLSVQKRLESERRIVLEEFKKAKQKIAGGTKNGKSTRS